MRPRLLAAVARIPSRWSLLPLWPRLAARCSISTVAPPLCSPAPGGQALADGSAAALVAAGAIPASLELLKHAVKDDLINQALRLVANLSFMQLEHAKALRIGTRW